MVLVLAIVSAILSLGTAKATQAAINSTTSNRITLQAQQYCVGKLELLRNKGYKNVSSQSKQVIRGNYYDEVILGDEVVVDSSKYKPITVQCFYKDETKPRSSITSMVSTAESTSSGAWVKNFPRSGIAPSDGIIVATSDWNSWMAIYTSGVARTVVYGRGSYGSGTTNATCPVAKGEKYSVSGGSAQFFSLQ